jgi:hypothetical protein
MAIPAPRERAFEVARRAWAALGVLRFEWRTRRQVEASLGERLACLRQGFNTRSASYYGTPLPPDPQLYISDWREAALSKRPNRAYALILDDKLAFWLTLKPLTRHLAPVSGLVHQGRYFPADDAVSQPIESLLRCVTAPVVLKPVRGTLGRGIYILDPKADGLLVNGRPGSHDMVAPRLRRGTYVVAPWIRQAAYARTIFPESVNSIRVMTMVDPDSGAPFIPFAVHRFGVSRTAPFDGFGAGGIVAGLDVTTGRIGPAISAPPGQPRIVQDTHPDSGIPIAGTVVPRWAEICRHLLDLAAQLPFLPYVGWDVIVTDESFLINEGNSRPSLRVVQACGPLLQDERVRRFYRYHGVIPS